MKLNQAWNSRPALATPDSRTVNFRLYLGPIKLFRRSVDFYRVFLIQYWLFWFNLDRQHPCTGVPVNRRPPTVFKVLIQISTADVSISQGLGKTVLIHPDFSNSNSCKGLLGQMEEAGTNGRSPVDKWKCQGQMDKSNHSKPTRVVGRGRDNFDSIFHVTLVVFHTFKNCVYGGAINLIHYSLSFDSIFAVLIQYWYFDSLISIMIQYLQF
ncbi:hypothetical protein LXL04_027708 [Taraxacum kok-saghyz]